jgi:hypothetical protein
MRLLRITNLYECTNSAIPNNSSTANQTETDDEILAGTKLSRVLKIEIKNFLSSDKNKKGK